MATRKRTWKELTTAIQRTFRLWKVRSYSIEPLDAPARRDRYHSPEQRKVIVRFALDNRGIVLCSVSHSLAHENLELLASALETMRLSNVRRFEHLLIAAYRQLDPGAPIQEVPPGPKAGADPYAILGVSPNYPLPVIEAIWKAHLRVTHPDMGGNADEAQRLNTAMSQIRKQKGGY